MLCHLFVSSYSTSSISPYIAFHSSTMNRCVLMSGVTVLINGSICMPCIAAVSAQNHVVYAIVFSKTIPVTRLATTSGLITWLSAVISIYVCMACLAMLSKTV